MSSVRFQGRSFELRDGKSVLDALLDAGEDIPHSCRRGTCGSCRLRAVEGDVPAEAQRSLKEPERRQGWFLACCCRIEGAAGVLEVELAPESRPQPARVHEREEIGDDIVRLRLILENEFGYTPGQFVNLVRHDGLARPYSLASIPDDGVLELHVKVVPDGRMSGWVDRSLDVGDPVSLEGPFGSCFYVPGRPDQPLILAGVGTGLAPLLGIARDALRRGHTGPIDLFHGARDASRLYATDLLRELEARHESFRYHPCALRKAEPVSGAEATGAESLVSVRPVGDVVLEKTSRRLAEARIFLCGAPDFVQDLRKRLFIAGASLSGIHADPFTPQAQTGG